jgi:hypothetical protein
MFSKKVVLWFFLIFLIVAIALVLVRLFDATSSIAGYGLATIGISILIAVLFTLFLISVAFTSMLLLAGQKRWIDYRPGSLLDKFVRLWDDFPSNRSPTETVTVDEEPATAEEIREPWLDEFALADLDELLGFIANGKGRGRKSDTSDELRFRVVRDWSIMQMRGTSTKLQDFLDERFGNHVDGSPKVPVPTFYGWRKKFIKELKKYKDAKKK